MAVRTARRRWSRMVWARLAVLLLWLGHGVWVFLGVRPQRHYAALVEVVSRPGQTLAARYRDWRQARRTAALDLVQARAENARLTAEVEQLRQQLAAAAPRLEEAESASRLLGLKRQIPLELSAARVVFSTRPAAFGGLILDQGRDRGLVEDQGVIAPEGIVGRVWSVSATQSKVLPADAPNASVAVMLMRSRATGVLQGLGSGRALIRYISNQEVVQVGEAVLTSGLDRVFPRGLLVGTVTAVRKADLELRVEVVLSVALDRLQLVLLLPPSPPLEVQPPFLVTDERPGRKRGAP